ncbi:MAG TPA: hypothetical protein VMK65_12590, partial [Longimicrobiales bacterium]|nr:hypothetical protein [Longimicrobiales bacterium]
APASTGIIARYVGGAPAITIGYAKKTIGPAGGSLRLLDFEIVVPPNAVSKSTEFMIRLPVDPHERELVMAEFGPHGASFAVPVTLRFPLAGTTLEGDGAAAVVWWDGEVWRRLESRTTADGRIEADTDHFSTYGTSDEGESYFGELSSGG